MTSQSLQAGFSAVELMISLFIAAAFLGSGYQLYSVIIKEGAEANARSIASNVAYNALRQYSPQTTTNCSNVTVSPSPTIPEDSGLGDDASLQVTISCPYGVGNATSKIVARVTYGQPSQEVIHGTYITK